LQEIRILASVTLDPITIKEGKSKLKKITLFLFQHKFPLRLPIQYTNNIRVGEFEVLTIVVLKSFISTRYDPEDGGDIIFLDVD
jgi:hypothetical protein